MSAIKDDNVLDRRPDIKTGKKIERPKKYEVVYYYDTPKLCECGISILRKVFNKGAREAYKHVLNAQKNKKEPVFSGGKDEVETKVAEGNEAREWHRDNCGPLVMSTFFKCELLPQ